MKVKYIIKYSLGLIVIYVINEFLKKHIVFLRFFIPDLYIIYLIYNSILIGNPGSSLSGFIIGFLQDIFSPLFFGFNTLVKTILGIISGELKSKIEISGNWYIGFIYSLVVIINDFIYFFLNYLTDFKKIFSLIFYRSLPTAFMSFIVGIGLNYIFDKIFSAEVKASLDVIEKE